MAGDAHKPQLAIKSPRSEAPGRGLNCPGRDTMNVPDPRLDDDLDVEALLKSDKPYLACTFFGEPDERDVWDTEVEAADDPGSEWGA